VKAKKKTLEQNSKKPKGYSERSKKMGVSTYEERLAERNAMMRKKRYSNGGQIDPTKKKKVNREQELTKMAKMAKQRLAEMEGEKAYLRRRKDADRAYKQALKEGATEAQAVKLAEKYLD
jgi:hypothetical protein